MFLFDYNKKYNDLCCGGGHSLPPSGKDVASAPASISTPIIPQVDSWIKDVFGTKEEFDSFLVKHAKEGEWTDDKGIMCQVIRFLLLLLILLLLLLLLLLLPIPPGYGAGGRQGSEAGGHCQHCTAWDWLHNHQGSWS